MAVSVDTVYQRVLALANKEQRGYITPQEFNLFANQAQLETIEQYFYDINQFSRLNNNETDYSDMISLLNEKLGVFKKHSSNITKTSGYYSLPNDLLTLGKVFSSGIEVDEVKYSDIALMQRTSLLNNNVDNPVYYIRDNKIYAVGTGSIVVSYVRKPDPVSWGYVVVSEKAMYDPSLTNNFELHPLEETDLVYRILTLSGITLNKADLASGAMGLLAAKTQQEKQ